MQIETIASTWSFFQMFSIEILQVFVCLFFFCFMWGLFHVNVAFDMWWQCFFFILCPCPRWQTSVFCFVFQAKNEIISVLSEKEQFAVCGLWLTMSLESMNSVSPPPRAELSRLCVAWSYRRQHKPRAKCTKQIPNCLGPTNRQEIIIFWADLFWDPGKLKSPQVWNLICVFWSFVFTVGCSKWNLMWTVKPIPHSARIWKKRKKF